MSDILKSIILGILEGITEFLPISSTGHLIVATQLLNFRLDAPGFRSTFEIFIQSGAIVAVLIYYSRDLLQQARTINTPPTQRWWLAIIVAAIPGLILGFLLSSKIEELLFRPSVVALSMIVGGVFMYAAEVYQAQQEKRKGLAVAANTTSAEAATHANVPPAEGEVTMMQALIVGLFQVLALIPGMSRSAMSIIGGMFAGLSRPVATRFSFYLALPVLGSATAYALLKHLSDINGSDLMLLLIGAVVSGIVAWFVIGWFLRYIARNSFIPFAIYRIIVGVMILALVSAGLLK